MKKNTFILFILLGCLNANAQLGYWNNKHFVELTPDESFIYKYVLAMDTESKNTIEVLLAGKSETEDKSIIKSEKGGWFIRNDYPLPEGNYYESAFYNNDSKAHYLDHYIILPTITFSLKDEIAIDNLLEQLDSKVILVDSNNRYGRTNYTLACQMKTSGEVLEAIKLINDFNLESMKFLSPEKFSIHPIADSFLIKILTGNYELSEPKLIYEMNWEGVDYPVVYSYAGTEVPWQTTDEGLAITNPAVQEYPASMLVDVNNEYFPLEQSHNYIVRLTLKVPSNGTYVVDMGSWETNFTCEVPANAGDDFQVFNVGFPDFAQDVENQPDFKNSHILLAYGLVAGTTIVKKVEVYEVNNSNAKETGITAVHACQKADNAIYNLAGQEVSSSYKGIVIRNGKKVVQGRD